MKTLRRYLLLQAADAVARLDMGLASILWGRQEAEPGTLIPANTPAYAELIANHYKTVEDIDGSNPAELTKLAGISARDAQAIYSFLGLTIPPDDDSVPAPAKHVF